MLALRLVLVGLVFVCLFAQWRALRLRHGALALSSRQTPSSNFCTRGPGMLLYSVLHGSFHGRGTESKAPSSLTPTYNIQRASHFFGCTLTNYFYFIFKGWRQYPTTTSRLTNVIMPKRRFRRINCHLAARNFFLYVFFSFN